MYLQRVCKLHTGQVTAACRPMTVCVYTGEALARYGFGDDHPFGPDRHDVFVRALQKDLAGSKVSFSEPVIATAEEIERFHTPGYVKRVIQQSKTGVGMLDGYDTPAFPGVYEAAATVVGTVLKAAEDIINGHCDQAFVPIAGLHHARRDGAAGFCVFNDCGVVIETLLGQYGLQRVAYIDIDAHHGDGVFYGFEDDPRLVFADLHEDGRYLYPGTGMADESGCGEARGTKLNIPMAPGADDQAFYMAWERVERHLEQHPPNFILLQCGADSIAGDPITHMRYSPAAHRHTARRLQELAGHYCAGRLLALGGGGYNRENLAAAWVAVVSALV